MWGFLLDGEWGVYRGDFDRWIDSLWTLTPMIVSICYCIHCIHDIKAGPPKFLNSRPKTNLFSPWGPY